MRSETVAAVSTPLGKGAIALIRISGEDAVRIASAVFVPRGKRLDVLEGGRCVYGDIYFEGEIIDDGMATVFRAPHSYTGEDTVEICCHGGVLLTQTVLMAVYAAGASPAEAGEFTKRAYLAGKLKLDAAEAIIAKIEAESRSKMFLASRHAAGELEKEVEAVYEKTLRLLGSIYVGSDYPEEGLEELTPDEIKNGIFEILSDLKKLGETYRTGKAVSEGIITVIAGKPNTGKSSLLNLISGEERAIVTEEAGTTRDVIEQTVSMGDVLLRLCDTAGIRSASARAEMLGVIKTREKLAQAELVLAVFDGSEPFDKSDTDVVSELSALTCPVIFILNKSDRGQSADTSPLPAGSTIVRLSAKTGDGLDSLRETVNRLYKTELLSGGGAILANARQYGAVSRAAEAAGEAYSAVCRGTPPDIAGTLLEEAMSHLGEVDGRTVSEQITDDIFHRFCVGK